MKKVIVYGLGKEYKTYKHLINDLFEVVGMYDRDMVNRPDYGIEKCELSDLVQKEFDYIIVCSEKYKDSIVSSIYEENVDLKKVLLLSDIVKCFENDLEKTYNATLVDKKKYESLNIDDRFSISENNLHIINEKNDPAGVPSVHYFAQDIWAARKIREYNPAHHYDIGSRLDGFIAHLLVFRDVNYIDIRPLPYEIDGLHYIYGDATKLENIKSDSLESISCLHALEHFGLGRYGDEVDPEGYLKFCCEIKRVLKKGGHLFLGVPVGPKDKCVFNAHRIFSFSTVLDIFGDLILKDIGVIGIDDVNVHIIGRKDYEKIEEYSCGVFEFEK